MPTMRQAVKRLRDRWLLPPAGTVSVSDLIQRFRPVPRDSFRSLLSKMNMLADVAEPVGGSTHPYYRRTKPNTSTYDAAKIASNTAYIDLTEVHLPPYGALNTVSEAVRHFDGRAAAAVSSAVGLENGVDPGPGHGARDLLEELYSGKASAILIPTDKCLAVMAYPDYFPDGVDLRPMVSKAILAASPGWCGSFGPGVDGSTDVIDLFGKHEEGNYDMSQMHLLPIAYRYYDELLPEAQDWLITVLLERGRIRRPNLDDIFTSGGAPNDWSRAGYSEVPLREIAEIAYLLGFNIYLSLIGYLLGGVHIKVVDIGETENHILTIHTARYLTNQLLYQRDHDPNHDNRRNGSKDALSCTELLLMLMRNILRNDFQEYNAKNYQNETRSALSIYVATPMTTKSAWVANGFRLYFGTHCGLQQ